MDGGIGGMAKIMGKDIEIIKGDKNKCSRASLPAKKMKTKSIGQEEAGLFLFMEKAQALGFSSEERQELFLLYGGHL